MDWEAARDALIKSLLSEDGMYAIELAAFRDMPSHAMVLVKECIGERSVLRMSSTDGARAARNGAVEA